MTSNNMPTASDRAAAVIQYALTHSVDISPADEAEWTRFCNALKVLGYDCNTFVALSNCATRDAVAKWQAQKTPAKYVHSEDAAAACILYHADRAGVCANNLCSPSQPWRVQRPKPMPTPPPAQPKEVVSVPLNIVREQAAKVMQTNLAKYLCSLFPAAEVGNILTAYLVGATTAPHYYNCPEVGLWTTYPLINSRGVCIDLKMMGYKADGHRYKPNNSGAVSYWLSATDQINDTTDRGDWCCFGDHFATHYLATDPVNVVESEKTALMASLYFGGYWVAVGGLTFLSPDRLAAHRHRQIIIYPDADGVTAWTERTAKLIADGYNARMDNWGIKIITRLVADGKLPQKADLGDLIAYLITSKL